MAKMVVKKKKKSLGFSDDPSRSEMEELIEESVEEALVDSSRHDEVISKFKSEIL